MPKLIEHILYIHTYIYIHNNIQYTSKAAPEGLYRPRDEKNTPVNNIILYYIILLLWRTRLYTHTHTQYARGDLCLYIIYLFGR